MRVADKMTREPVTLAERSTLREATELMRSRRIRHLPIVDGRKLIGIVTDRDVKRATPSVVGGASKEEYDRTLDRTTLGQIMTRNPVSVFPSTTMRDAVALIVRERIGSLPVVLEGELVGIVTETDCMKAYLDLLIEFETLFRRHFQ
ncbi:MAG: CBS domain-containing protein [Planctomycetes bacterium]|nr:CBS domain-containing protein [Planctomycetota bacterium]